MEARKALLCAILIAAIALAGLVLLLAGGCSKAEAIKHDPDPAVELDRVRTELRLRIAELEVTRGQLRACQRRGAIE